MLLRATAERSSTTDAICSSSSGSSTSRARSSASAASGRAPGSRCCSAETDGDPLVPADQGGAGLGARGVRRRERVRELGRARRRRAAHDAGDERHLPRLAERRAGHRRIDARLLRPPAARLEGLGRDRGNGPSCHDRLRAALRLRRSHTPTRAPAIALLSPPISVAATCSIEPFSRSARPMPSRTSGTTRSSWKRSGRAGSTPSTACNPRKAAAAATVQDMSGCAQESNKAPDGSCGASRQRRACFAEPKGSKRVSRSHFPVGLRQRSDNETARSRSANNERML